MEGIKVDYIYKTGDVLETSFLMTIALIELLDREIWRSLEKVLMG